MDRPANSIEIEPVDGPVDIQIRPPGSKSITNRALLCAAMSEGVSYLEGVLNSDDTRVMIGCLTELGVQTEIAPDCPTTLTVRGCGGNFPNQQANLYVENSGTTIRFLTAALALHGGKYRLHGIDRMHERPIGQLVDSLNLLDLNVSAESDGGCPPVAIENNRVLKNRTRISGSVSSQYLSGLMMASPLAPDGLSIDLQGELVSKPYVAMTQKVMESFGIHSTLNLQSDPSRFFCGSNQSYQGAHYSIEPDASAASYFWAAAAICGGRAKITGLGSDSLQGDVNFVKCLEKMGCRAEFGNNQITLHGGPLRGIDVDMSDISDTVQTLSVVALFAKGSTRIRGVAHNRVKETDRIGDLATELRKLGAEVTEHQDGLTITPTIIKPAVIETYNDHRMAMSLALAGLRSHGIVITNPGCTAKTYPEYFDDLAKAVGQ